MAGKKKALVFSPTLATFGVDKVPERRKYGMSDPSGLESEKEKDCDFQPTKKWRMKRSASKGKQSTSLKHYCWKTISKGYAPKIPRTQKWAVSTFKQWIVSCKQHSAVDGLKPVDKECTKLCCRVLCLFLMEAWKTNGESF